MVKQYMKAVMTSGTGQSANVEGYDIGGKTGTAEKLPRGNEEYVLSFIGYAPQENPEVVIYVVIDEPNVQDQGTSAYVLDLSKKIMSQAFPYMNITTMEGYTGTTQGVMPDSQLQQQTDYQDFDASYEDTYDKPDGSYIDENYTPDLDDWASGEPAE